MKIAIYSRKSKFTGKGESIENQITLCHDYIKTHIPEATDNDILVYEDEGFSAKNLDRPQFKAMMLQAKKTPFDYIVVYRLDRISRNVGDFASLIEKLNEMKTAFICIKEQFDTSTPMGRAMMNIAAVFAQLERETIAERIHDNVILLARTGRWLGGVTPLGFKGEKIEIQDAESKKRSAFKLSPVPEEIKTVKLIYEKFQEFHSLTKTAAWLISHDIQTREGKEFRLRAVKDILKNPVYCVADEAAYDYFTSLGSDVCFTRDEADGKHGLMSFGRTEQSSKKTRRKQPDEWIISIGRHKGIISSETWIKVQKMIGENADKTFYTPNRNEVSMFSGLVRCADCGSIMRVHTIEKTRQKSDTPRQFTYMCELKERSRKSKCSMQNVNGNVLDEIICKEILKYGSPKSTVGKQLNALLKQSENDETTSTEKIAELQKQASAKEKMISNLIQTLAKSDEASSIYEYTKREVERLDGELKQLNNEIAEISFLNEEVETRSEQIDEIVSSLKEFKNNFDKLSIVEKRDYMHRIIDRIEWDGENAHIFIRAAAS